MPNFRKLQIGTIFYIANYQGNHFCNGPYRKVSDSQYDYALTQDKRRHKSVGGRYPYQVINPQTEVRYL